MTEALHDAKPPRLVVVMGASGTGKTTVGLQLATSLGWRFLDADELHDPASVAKMAAGEPLDEQDRAPWLEQLAEWVDAVREEGEPAVLACSALRRRHRDVLRRPDVAFVHLVAPRALVEDRLEQRRGHYMPPSLLRSQLAILEPPRADERAITIDAALPGDEQVRLARQLLGLDEDDEGVE